MARRKRKKKVSGKLVLAIVILLILLVIALGVLYYLSPDTFKKIFGIDDGVAPGPGSVTQGSFVKLNEDDCSVHFLELGNDNAGDCILIKVGNNEVLIDAGSKSNSIDTISAYIDKYCTDRVLEYVIATHAHEDHYACFAGENDEEYKTIFDRYECKTIIDFPNTNKVYTGDFSKQYDRYVREVQDEVSNGAKHYNALQCWNNEGNGAQRQYDLGHGVGLNILYSYYYEEDVFEKESSISENEFSVCTMLVDGDVKYLLTGDLEEKGEKYLAEYNDLSNVSVFKAGHHGSKTSNSDELLKEAKPSIVVFTAVMGSYEYSKNIENVFPTLLACSNISKYTTNMYITSIFNFEKDMAESYNGNIVIVSNDSGISVVCSGTTKSIVESDWYKTNRTPKINL